MRIAVINYDNCKPDRCALECVRFCPINRSGSKAIELSDAVRGKPVIYEETCIGCGICVRKCPYEAIEIANLPDEAGEPVHRYKVNGFTLFGLPIIKRGVVVGLLGKNSTGKSTILRILAGELIPNFGEPQSQPSKEKVLEKFRGKEMYDYFNKLYSGELKVVHKIQYVEAAGRYLKGTVRELLQKVDERRKLDEVKDLLNMKNILDKNVKDLSGGELQKLLVAASVLREADVYLFDEPASYLDVAERLDTARTVKEMTKNKYVVVAEHDLIVLDYLSDQLNVLYGQSSVYGRVSKAYSSRVGINNFLRGYLPAENVQIRKEEIKFEFRDMSELDLLKNVKEKVVWSHIRKNLGGFRLEVEEGAAREGEIIGVLGPNGIGKTTFARILVGEVQPDEGFVNTVGLTLSYKPQKILPEYDGTVQQYLEEVRKDALSSTSWFYTEVVRRLNLHRILESKLTDLSGGELQKLYITGALAKDADVYVLDEPSSYLDVEERYVVAKAIKKIIRERKSICFVVEHDLAIHNYIADRIMVFKGVPGLEGHGTAPLSLRSGMNEFLKLMDLTFRRDGETGRPRVNKPGSYLDRVQKELGEYFSTRVVKEAEAE